MQLMIRSRSRRWRFKTMGAGHFLLSPETGRYSVRREPVFEGQTVRGLCEAGHQMHRGPLERWARQRRQEAEEAQEAPIWISVSQQKVAARRQRDVGNGGDDSDVGNGGDDSDEFEFDGLDTKNINS